MGSVAVVIDNPWLMAMARIFEVEPCVSVTVTLNGKLPAAVGVPVIAPELLNDNPAGKTLPAVIDHVVVGDEPKALRIVLYGIPVVPPGSAGVATAKTRSV